MLDWCEASSGEQAKNYKWASTCLRCFWRAFLAALRLMALVAPALASWCSAACSLVWPDMTCSSEGSMAVVAAAAAEAASLAAACRKASISNIFQI